jgi:hypothetical protein
MAGKLTELDTYKTPPFPVTWPPTGAAVRFYDMRITALPTGVIAYSIDSPSVEITVPLDGSPVTRRPLKREKLGRYERVSRRIVEPWAFTPLLQVLCENRMPNAREAAEIREVYGWFLDEFPLYAAWLRANSSPFIAWVTEKPTAPAVARLTARLEGEAVVLTGDRKDIRFEHAGLKDSQLSVVPLKADGTDPALWITAGAEGMLVRYANPPQVVYSLTYGGGRPMLFSTNTSVWLMDVDGDGLNDVIEYKRTRSDVGDQGEGPRVLRSDSARGTYEFDKTLTKKAPWVHVNHDERPMKLISKSLGVPQVELRGRMDLFSVEQPSAPAPQSIGGGGSPPFVGPDVVYRVFTRKPGQKLGGHYHLAHVRYGKDPSLVSLIDLGEVGFPPSGCGDRKEELRREGDSVMIVWPFDSNTLVEQRVKFDGKNFVKPEKAPVKVADCSGL